MAGKNQAAKSAPKQNAPNPVPGPEFYTYVSREKIRALVLLSELDVEKFVRGLELEVYKNDPRQMDYICDKREHPAKVIFIIKCVLIHYKVPDHLRKFVHQSVIHCMDKRVLAKTTKA